MSDAFEYDPERSLWRPGRRRFLFMFGAALAGTLLPGEDLVRGVDLASGPDFTTVACFDNINEILKEVYHPHYFVELMERESGWRREIVKHMALPTDLMIRKPRSIGKVSLRDE